MTTHTPGPWTFGGKTAESQTVVYAVHPHSQREVWVADCNKGDKSAAECCANARLIAAAPEMRENLRDALLVLNYLDNEPSGLALKVQNAVDVNVGELVDQARALLARIGG